MAGGKPSNFSPAQVAVLKKAMDDYLESRPGMNQTALGDLLGIGQQSISNFKSGKTTLFYQPASRLANLAGFSGLDALFAAHGVAPPGVSAQAEIPGLPAEMPTAKRTATRLALEAGASVRAILHICTAPEWTADSHRGRQVDWWFNRMMEATRADDAPIPDRAGLAAEKGQKTRKTNAVAKAATEARKTRAVSAPHSSTPPATAAKKKIAG